MEEIRHKSSPRDVFLYLLAIITLYISMWRFIDLLFEYVNVLFPDDLNQYWFWTAASSAIRIDMSALIVVFPVYLGLTWFLRKDAIAHPEKREMRVRKWLLNLTLFLTAVTIIVDLVMLINGFLEGDLTARFVLKVLTVLVVAACVFAYYLWDLRRETVAISEPSKLVAGIAAAVVGASIIVGFFVIGSPFTQRQRRFDERRVSDLQMTQNEIINYWTQKNRLPGQLSDLQNSISGFAPPSDPATREPYEYKTVNALQFELCATFALSSDGSVLHKMRTPDDPYGQNWNHEAGRVCFSRTIDPEIYRPRPLKYD